MSILVFAIATSLMVSFLCSLCEAVLLSIPVSYLKRISDEGSKSGKILLAMKSDLGRPISGILILNTISNSAGPAIAGAIVANLYGEVGIVIFSAVITVLTLVIAEMLPKIIGVNYGKNLAKVLGHPLQMMVTVLAPLIWIFKGISKRIQQDEAGQPSVSLDELISLTTLGQQEGAIDEFEGSVITNVIGLDKLLVKDVHTPRVVVFRIAGHQTLGEVEKQLATWTFSRVPTYNAEDEDHLTGYVIQRDIYRELLSGNRDKTLREMARPLHTVPELMRVDVLALQMFERKEQICAVVDEHGGLSGIITLEDIIEEVIGHEIVDEYDAVSDLRTFAKFLKYAKTNVKKKRRK